jgi:cytochrome c-type biogenesis protein CcmH/NrfG
MKHSMLALVLAAVLSPGAVLAAGEVNTKPLDPVLEKAQDATNHEDWAGAQAILKEALARTPNNPEYHNEYAYALRKGPKPDMSLVFQHYNEALRLDPKHRGANEYLGEAYLMIGNLPKAQEQLATLDKICFLPCKEYSELKASIAAYEAKGK